MGPRRLSPVPRTPFRPFHAPYAGRFFGDRSRSKIAFLVAQALADIATIGILQERAIHRGEVLTEQLQTALNSRVIIEQAKGVLSHAGNLDMDQTFEILRGYARHHSARLSDVAAQLANASLDPQTVLTHLGDRRRAAPPH